MPKEAEDLKEVLFGDAGLIEEGVDILKQLGDLFVDLSVRGLIAGGGRRRLALSVKLEVMNTLCVHLQLTLEVTNALRVHLQLTQQVANTVCISSPFDFALHAASGAIFCSSGSHAMQSPA